MTGTEKKEMHKGTKDMVESTKYMLDGIIDAVDQDIKVVKTIATKYATLNEMNKAMIDKVQSQFNIAEDSNVLDFAREQAATYVLISKMLAEAGVFLCDLKDVSEKRRRELDDYEIVE